MKHSYNMISSIPHLDQNLLEDEIRPELPNLDYTGTSGGILDIFFTVALTSPEIVTLNGLIGSHSLGAAKKHRKQEIDIQTTLLIAAGFTHESKQFSLSITAQLNWSGVITMGAADSLTYPYPVATMYNDYYMAADIAEMLVIAAAALSRKGWAVGTGAVFKKSIADAVDQAALDAIIDNRS